MRVLTVGNLYPPHGVGGYEVTWRSSVRWLREQGHEVRVLTTDWHRPGVRSDAPEDDDVHRELRWYWHDHSFPRLSLRERVARERHNARTFDRHVEELRPDAICWWAMGGMSLALIERARRHGLPAVGVVGDDWMAYGPRVDGWLRAARRPLVGPLAERALGIPARVELRSAAIWLFNSERTRQASLELGPLDDVRVVRPGVDHRAFRAAPERDWRWRLLYAGRIDPRKGIATAVEALAALPAEAELQIVGDGEPREVERLRALAARHGLERRVLFRGAVTPDDMPQAYAASDAVLFPVEWEEPWGLVPLEAMAVGRPVVATGTGGSGEYLRDGENCLLFARGDAQALAECVTRLGRDPVLRRKLREGGLATAVRYPAAAYDRSIAAALDEVVGHGR